MIDALADAISGASAPAWIDVPALKMDDVTEVKVKEEVAAEPNNKKKRGRGRPKTEVKEEPKVKLEEEAAAPMDDADDGDEEEVPIEDEANDGGELLAAATDDDEPMADAPQAAGSDTVKCPMCRATCGATDEYCGSCGGRVQRLGSRRSRGSSIGQPGGAAVVVDDDDSDYVGGEEEE